MIFASPPRAVSDAQARLDQESPAARQLRQTVRQLWEAAELLPPGVARAALHLEALRLGRPTAQVPLDPPLEHRLLMEALDTDATTVDEFRKRRLVGLGFAAISAGVMAVLLVGWLGRISEPKDLAENLVLKTSSVLAECHPAQGECGGYPTKVRFHTVEELNPWAQYDFTTPTQFSAVTIVNRSDMGEQRAIPLVIEVSDDGLGWREVIRRGDVFFVWRAEFPKQTARYLRVRVDRISWLHLEAIKVHP